LLRLGCFDQAPYKLLAFIFLLSVWLSAH
jgi:hypothetical protein